MKRNLSTPRSIEQIIRILRQADGARCLFEPKKLLGYLE